MQLSASIILGIASLARCAMGATDDSLRRYELVHPDFTLVSGNEVFTSECTDWNVTLSMTDTNLNVHVDQKVFPLAWNKVLKIEIKDASIEGWPYQEFTIRGLADLRSMLKLSFKLNAITPFTPEFEEPAAYHFKNEINRIRTIKKNNSYGKKEALHPFDLGFTAKRGQADERLKRVREKYYDVSNLEYWTESNGAVLFPNAKISLYEHNWTYKLNIDTLDGRLTTIDMKEMHGHMNVNYQSLEYVFIFKGKANEHYTSVKQPTYLKFETKHYDAVHNFNNTLKKDPTNQNAPVMDPDMNQSALNAIGAAIGKCLRPIASNCDHLMYDEPDNTKPAQTQVDPSQGPQPLHHNATVKIPGNVQEAQNIHDDDGLTTESDSSDPDNMPGRIVSKDPAYTDWGK